MELGIVEVEDETAVAVDRLAAAMERIAVCMEKLTDIVGRLPAPGQGMYKKG